MPVKQLLDSVPPSDREQKALLAERYRVAQAGFLDGSVIFGAARLGETILGQLSQLGVTVAGFADNDSNRWGSEFCGLPILSPKDIGADQPVIVASKYIKDIVAGLGSRSAPPIPHYILPIFFPNHFEGIYHGLSANLIRAAREEILEAYALFEDEASRNLFTTLLKFRITLDPLDLPDPVGNQYFPAFWPMSDLEAYVDVGACDGDTLRAFLKHGSGKFSRYYALEPDPRNMQALRQSIPPEVKGKVTVIPIAAGAKRGTVSFIGDLGGESRVGNGGNISAEVAPLDELLAEQPVTAIKVDVEGYEAEVLQGARETIAKHKPKIALSVYHKIEDLWTLPNWMKRQGIAYRYLLRHHTPEIYDTVLYCLPVANTH